MRSMLNIKRYNWRAVFRIFLQKKFGIPYKRKPSELTPAELIYTNKFHLIAYS